MKIRFGALIVGATGKSQGQTIQRYRRGSFLRKITVPVQRLGSTQNPQRFVSSFIFNQWNKLNSSVRSDWSAVGARTYRTDSYGDEYTLSGREAFTSFSSITYPWLNALINPSLFNDNVPTFTTSGFELSVTSEELSLHIADETFVEFYQVKCKLLPSLAVNPQVSKLTTFIRTDTPNDVSLLYGNLLQAIPTLRVGSVVAISVRAVNSTGLFSPWVQQTVVAT